MYCIKQLFINCKKYFLYVFENIWKYDDLLTILSYKKSLLNVLKHVGTEKVLHMTMLTPSFLESEVTSFQSCTSHQSWYHNNYTGCWQVSGNS